MTTAARITANINPGKLTILDSADNVIVDMNGTTPAQLAADIIKIADLKTDVELAHKRYLEAQSAAREHITQTLRQLDNELDKAHKRGLEYDYETLDLGDGRTIKIEEEWHECRDPLTAVTIENSPKSLAQLQNTLRAACQPS